MALRTSRANIGARLRQARTDRGEDLDRVAAVTGIDRSVLEALEHDAPPEELHGPVYARIFLREYARHLGLNPKPLVGAYRVAHPEPERPLIGGPQPVDRRPAWWLKPGLVLLSVATLTALVVMRAERPSPEVVPSQPGAPAPASPQPSPVSPSPVAEPTSGLHLVLRVMDAPSWVRVVRGEEILVEETLPPGTVRTFRAPRELHLVLGYAPAVELTANDTRLQLPESLTVYSVSVVLRDDGPRLVDTA